MTLTLNEAIQIYYTKKASKMRRGAIDLLNEYHHQKRCIAAAWVRGEIPERDSTYVMEVIDQDDIEAAKQNIPKEFWTTAIAIAQLQADVEEEQAAREAEEGEGDHIGESGRRVGLVPYKIRVHMEGEDQGSCWRDYKVLATRALDARIIAFALDGGYGWEEQADNDLDDGHVELAITWTEVLEDE